MKDNFPVSEARSHARNEVILTFALVGEREGYTYTSGPVGKGYYLNSTVPDVNSEIAKVPKVR